MAITRKKTLGFSDEAEPTPEPEPELPPALVLLPAPTLPSPVQPVALVKPVKRHPRNIPKFAAWK